MNLNEIIKLLGEPIDSAEAEGILRKYPSLLIDDESDGAQYVTSEELGIDLLFRPDDGFCGNSSVSERKCQSVFLYSEGKDDHSQYSGEIPLGMKLEPSREHGRLEKER